jgi:hypothetical protein
VKEDCLAKVSEEPYWHRKEVQWGVMGGGTLATAAGLWFGGRRAAAARRRRIRRMIQDELQALGVSRG